MYGIEEFEPTNVHFDYELVIINAITSEFPDANIDLCFFHLKQSSYRHIVDLGLKVQYANNAVVSEYFHMMAALAYIPGVDVHGPGCSPNPGI